MNNPIQWLLALCLALPQLAWGGGVELTTPADRELEPLLVGDQAIFLRDGGLFVLNGSNGGTVPVRERSAEGGPIISPAAALGEHLEVAWIEKGPGTNRLYLSTAGADGRFDPKPKPLAEGPSTFVRLYPDEDGGLYLVDGSSQKTPALFLSHRKKGTQELQRRPLALEGFRQIYRVSAVVIASHLHIFVHGRDPEGGAIALLDYDSASGEAAPLQTVARLPGTPLLEALVLKGKPALMFKALRDGHYSLNLATRRTEGWHSTPIAPADGMDVARLDYHVWPDGRLLVVFSGEQRRRFKQRVLAALSQDSGKSWHSTRLDSGEFGNTRAWLPRLAVDAERVAVVWEDARDIRSRIRLQLSTDGGVSWLVHDVPLSHGPHYAMRPRIGSENAMLWIAWQQYRSDAREELDLVMQSLSWDAAAALAHQQPPEIEPQEKERHLRQAVSAYWQAMIDDDRQAAYLAHDPFFQARIPFMQYAARRGPILYHRYEIKEISVQGNEAEVTAMVNFSAPKIKIMNDEQSIPPRDQTIRETWLFIDGTWLRKFVDPMSGGSAIVY